MATDKTLVCSCEDVTLEEVRRAFRLGHRDLESLKRYTGFGTGPCQGKACLALVTSELLRLGATPAEVAPYTQRPPADPVALGALAAIDPATLGESSRPGNDPRLLAPTSPGPPGVALPSRADVVIVGGGIMGLALAWNLARSGVRDVVVLERSYLNAGASGRNGGGVRAQWSTPVLIRLAQRSIELCRRFAVDMGVNVWMRQGGYLFLAPGVREARRVERFLRLHERCGVPTRLVTPDEAVAIVPQLDRERFVAAAWNPDDAVVFPWPFLWGYAARAEALGVKILPFTAVTAFDRSPAALRAVETTRGRIDCGVVVNAAGAWSKHVAALAGVELPNRPIRHEILATESTKPWLDPLVSVLGTGLYFSQTQRGEIVGGLGNPAEPEGLSFDSSLSFLARFARAIVQVAPITAALRVVRQWAGCYDVTPDNNPILGPAGFANFLQLSGFVGHGFMMAPAVAERMARWMADGAPDEIFERFTLGRFERGKTVREDFIIG